MSVAIEKSLKQAKGSKPPGDNLSRPVAVESVLVASQKMPLLSRPLVAFLSSTIVHLALLIILAMVAIAGRGLGPGGYDLAILPSDSLNLDNASFATIPIEAKPIFESESEPNQNSSVDSQKSAELMTSIDTSDFSEALSTLSTESLSMLKTVPTISLEGNGPRIGEALIPTSSFFIGTSLASRDASKRSAYALKNGGSLQSEKAVEAALIWLAAHQYTDGGWSMSLTDPGDVERNRPACPCGGRCTGESREQLDLKRHAATGLALLSFLGAGYTHQQGKYKEEVYRAIAFLMDTMRDDNADPSDLRFSGQFSSGLSKHLMYEQGIATLALCEAYQMTKDPLLKNSCQRAINYIVRTQHYGGSWGYQPRTTGDLSIMGWQMMALRSAVASDLKINAQGIVRVDGFLATQQSEDGAYYGYRSTVRTPSMTAIGLLMRYYRGWPVTDPRMTKGVNYILETLPSPSDMYFNYYATQILFQTQSLSWPKWNETMRDYLVQTQAQDASSHEFGSWVFIDQNIPPSNAIGGRLYCTTMATLILEVYYRYLPTYQEDANDRFEF